MKTTKENKKEVYRTFNLTPDIAQKIFNKYNLGQVSFVKRFEQGMVNDVFSVDGKYVLKINSPHADLPKLAKEYVIYESLPKYNIPSPKPFFLDESRDIIPYPFIITEELLGKTLEKSWETLTIEQKRDYINKLGELLGKIHNLDANKIHLEKEKNVAFRVGFENRVNDIAIQLKESDVFSEEKILKIKEFYLNNPLFQEEIQPSLIHGNYNFANIIVREGVFQGVIDWEWARFGHSEEELAVFLWRELADDNQKELFKKAYSREHKISENFEQRYIPYVLLYYLGIMHDVHRWTHRPDKQREYIETTDLLIDKLGIDK